MPRTTCPFCEVEIKAPTDDPESLGHNLECPDCGRPLTWFHDERTSGKWIPDEGAEGRRRMSEGPDDAYSPAG